MAIGDDGGPQRVRDAPDNHDARLSDETGGDLEPIRVVPERLRVDEIDPVFRLVGGRLGVLVRQLPRAALIGHALVEELVAPGRAVLRLPDRHRSRFALGGRAFSTRSVYLMTDRPM